MIARHFFIFVILLLIQNSVTRAASQPQTLTPKKNSKSSNETIPYLTPVPVKRKVAQPKRGATKNILNLGVNTVRMSYSEVLPPPGSRENGFLFGADLGFVSYAIEGWILKANGDLHAGNTRYDGGLDSGGTVLPHQSTTRNIVLDGEAGIGRVFMNQVGLKVSSFLGFGVHFWNRGLTGEGSYTEHYLFTYVPVGVRLERTISEKLSGALEISYRFNLGGTIKISDLPGYYPSSGTLGKADGFKIKLPINFNFSPSVAFNITPHFEYFKIGEGEDFSVTPIQESSGTPKFDAHEPASKTYIYGAYAGITFQF